MWQAAAGESEAADEVKQMLEDHDKLVEEIFQHEDKDKNGFISHEEFSGPKHDELWEGRKRWAYILQDTSSRADHTVYPCDLTKTILEIKSHL